MTAYPLAAGGVVGVVAAAEVVPVTPGSGLLAPLVGAIASVLVAAIAAYAVIRQRRANAPEEMNALAVAKTAEANVATLRGEIQELTRKVAAIEDHVRPWPKAPQT